MQPVPETRDEATGVVVRHRVPGFSDRWELYEGQVPEAAWHDLAAERVRQLLRAFAARAGRDAHLFRNLAIRARQDRPSLGFDPDVCWVEPAPPDSERLDSLLLWLPEHPVPRLSIEFVSKSHPTKDYVEVPDQCAAVGVFELVVFDPIRSGPRAHGGPFLLQVWRRAEDGAFERVHAGDGPARSAVVPGFWIPREAERVLLLADDPDGHSLWLSSDEMERQRADAERQRADAERQRADAERQRADAERQRADAVVAEREALLRRIAELENKG
jgi:hypothetical protein